MLGERIYVDFARFSVIELSWTVFQHGFAFVLQLFSIILYSRNIGNIRMFRRHMNFTNVISSQLVIALVRQYVVFYDRFVGTVLVAVEFNNLILELLLFPEVE